MSQKSHSTSDRTVSPNAYKVLGVRPTDDFDTIRRVWRKLARDNHPDVVSGCPEAATQRFAEINDAFDQLRFHRKKPAKSEAEQQAEAALRARLRRRQEEKSRAEATRMADARRCFEEAIVAARPKPKAPDHKDIEPKRPLTTLEVIQIAAARRGYETLKALGLNLRTASSVDLTS